MGVALEDLMVEGMPVCGQGPGRFRGVAVAPPQLFLTLRRRSEQPVFASGVASE